MKLQLLSDLHLETETFDPTFPPPGAEWLVLAGDIDSTWHAGYERFRRLAGAGAGDRRQPRVRRPGLRCRRRRRCASAVQAPELHAAGARERSCSPTAAGARIRVLGTTRWSDFDLFGAAQRERAERAATYFMRLMASTRGGQPFDAAAVRAESLACRTWLETELRQKPPVSW